MKPDIIYCNKCESYQELDDSGYCNSCGNHFDNIISPTAKKLLLSDNPDDIDVAMTLIENKLL